MGLAWTGLKHAGRGACWGVYLSGQRDRQIEPPAAESERRCVYLLLHVINAGTPWITRENRDRALTNADDI